MRKYYTLLLNNTYDIEFPYFSKYNPCTMFPNILEKEIDSLDKLNDYFYNLDDTIIPTDEGYKVYGSFPVIGTIIDDKMYDVITNKEIKYTQNPITVNGLSYQIKEEIQDLETVKYLLSLLDKESIKKYKDNLNRVDNYYKNMFKNKDDKYYLIELQTSRADIYPILAKTINDELIDTVTKKRIYLLPYNAISSHLHCRYKEDITKKKAMSYSLILIESNINEYIKELEKAEDNAINKYNKYKNINSIVKSKTK